MTRFKISWKALSCLLLIHFVSELKIGSARRFSGFHLFSNATQRVYHHDLTIAVVEIDPNNKTINCELIYGSNDEQQSEFLHNLALRISQPIRASFDEMIELMSWCNNLDQNIINKRIANLRLSPILLSKSASFWYSLFNGIYPSTKWCGFGNIAVSYFDLGSKASMDKCCRTHDFCPVQISSGSTRYDLTNDSWFTRNHCTCEDELRRCLSNAMNRNTFAFFLSIIYFDVLRFPCIEDGKYGKKRFRSRSWL